MNNQQKNAIAIFITTIILLLGLALIILYIQSNEKNEYRQIVGDTYCSRIGYGSANCTWENTYDNCKDLDYQKSLLPVGIEMEVNYTIYNKTNPSQRYTEELYAKGWNQICQINQRWCNGERNYTKAEFYSNGTFACIDDPYWYNNETIIPISKTEKTEVLKGV